MTKRKKRSIVRGSRIFLDGAPPRWKPPIVSLSVDPVRDTEDDWLPNENDETRHPDELGDEAAALAFLDEVLGNVGEGDVVVGVAGATDSAAGEEPLS